MPITVGAILGTTKEEERIWVAVSTNRIGLDQIVTMWIFQVELLIVAWFGRALVDSGSWTFFVFAGFVLGFIPWIILGYLRSEDKEWLEATLQKDLFTSMEVRKPRMVENVWFLGWSVTFAFIWVEFLLEVQTMHLNLLLKVLLTFFFFSLHFIRIHQTNTRRKLLLEKLER